MRNTLVTWALLLIALPIHASYIIDTSVGTYDVLVLDGTFNEVQTTLELQPWWGDAALAEEFATAVDAGLGSPNANGGPLFAFAVDVPSMELQSFLYEDVFTTGVVSLLNTRLPGGELTFAVAKVAETPSPVIAWLLLLGMVGIVLGHRRSGSAPLPDWSAWHLYVRFRTRSPGRSIRRVAAVDRPSAIPQAALHARSVLSG